MINYQFFPRSQGVTSEMKAIIDCFKEIEEKIIQSPTHLESDKLLALVRPYLEALDFSVEKGKRKEDKIDVPVFFGENNQVDKSFYADAISADGKIVIEVEAGRAVHNNQFLKDIFQACMMFEVEYLVKAVMNEYKLNQVVNKQLAKTTKQSRLSSKRFIYQIVSTFL